MDAASNTAREIAGHRHAAAIAGRALLAGLRHADGSLAETTTRHVALRDESGLPVGLAIRWLSHGNSVIEGATRFREDAAELGEPWRTLLLEYAAALEHAGHAVPHAKLEPLAQATLETPAELMPLPTVDQSLYLRAGFSRAAPDPRKIVGPVEELVAELERQTEALFTLATELDQHPARRFTDHAPRVLRALCRFDLAKALRHNGPVLHASERLLGELLQGRLAPVLRELTAAIVRFEWYFKPLQVSAANRQIVLGGLGTSRPDLDARLILNAAERTVVGVAWFLGLHMLQPPERRRVLVLDDPTGAFDMTNQAGFISTLRAFARLTRPEQIIVTTHDDALAAVLAEELAPVDGWPASVGRMSCRRDEEDASVARPEWASASSRQTADESVQLGLEGEPVLFKR